MEPPLSGLDSYNKYAWLAVYIPQKGEVAAITPHTYRGFFNGCPSIDKTIVWGSIGKGKADLSFLKSLKDIVAIEAGPEQRMAFPVSLLEAGRERIEFVDAGPIISIVRSIKSEYEVECIRKACQAIAQAFETAFGAIEEGLSERDLDNRIKANMMEAGADNINFVNARIFPGAVLGVKQKGRFTKTGDYVWVDAGAMVEGYRCDFSRGCVLGNPSQEQQAAYGAIHNITKVCVDSVEPGISAAEIAAVADEESRKYGFPPKAAGRIGHGLGLDTSEIPSVAAWDHTILKPGMVFTIEPGYMAEHGYYVVEENILVTQNGCKVLSKCMADRLF